MVKRSRDAVWAVLPLLASCDPFAPSAPEAPTSAGTVQVATRPESVPGLWAKGVLAGNVLQTERLLDERFSGSSGGATMARDRFLSCLERLAKLDVDTARFAWSDTPTGETDSVWGDVDWTLVLSGGARFGGRATWAVVRDDAAEWKLARWVESSTSGNWSDACGGF